MDKTHEANDLKCDIASSDCQTIDTCTTEC